LYEWFLQVADEIKEVGDEDLAGLVKKYKQESVSIG
jgi:hypothetical protein